MAERECVRVRENSEKGEIENKRKTKPVRCLGSEWMRTKRELEKDGLLVKEGYLLDLRVHQEITHLKFAQKNNDWRSLFFLIEREKVYRTRSRI